MHGVRRLLKLQGTVLVAVGLLAASGAAGQASTFAILYNFKGGSDGASPNGVILGKNGALYGTTYIGGTNTCGLNVAYACGTLFELAHATGGGWTKTVLHSFNGADGAAPSSSTVGAPGPRLALGSNGALYGTTEAGGADDSSGTGPGGTVFELAPPASAGGVWAETVLYSLPHGVNAPHRPLGGVFVSSSGVVFGTTFSNHYFDIQLGGTVFSLTPPGTPGGSWTERTLFDFWSDGSLGMNPQASLVYAGGSLYGTTYDSNLSGGCGSVYEMSPPTIAGGAWTGTAIHSFAGVDGCNSLAPLTVGPGGVLYGTTFDGGSGTPCTYPPFFSSGCGTVFQLTPPVATGGAWAEAVIYSFTGLNADGAYPTAGVVLGKNGVLYGTTAYGGSATSGSPCTFDGAAGCGTVFELTPPAMPGEAWTETILHSFTGQGGEGSIPGPLALGSNGLLYGPTWSGGIAGYGTIFAVKP